MEVSVSIFVQCTWCKELFALVVIRLASALIAVCSIIFTRQAIHDIRVPGTWCIVAITIFRKITSIDRISAWRSRNLDLKQKNHDIKQNKTELLFLQRWKKVLLHNYSLTQSWPDSCHSRHPEHRRNRMSVCRLQHHSIYSCIPVWNGNREKHHIKKLHQKITMIKHDNTLKWLILQTNTGSY